MKTTYVFSESGMTIYPSIALAEQNLGVKALRRTLTQNSGVAYVGGALVVRPENEYDYDYLEQLIAEGLWRL